LFSRSSLDERPYLGTPGPPPPLLSLVGAILASVALFFMPTSSSLWMAAGLLWILDASINITMEPFRAFVADKLNADQRTTGFVMQSFFIGLGATFAGLASHSRFRRFRR